MIGATAFLALAAAGSVAAVPSEITPFDLVHGIKLIQAPGDKIKILCPAPAISSIECEGTYCNACCGDCCQCIKSTSPTCLPPLAPSWRVSLSRGKSQHGHTENPLRQIAAPGMRHGC